MGIRSKSRRCARALAAYSTTDSTTDPPVATVTLSDHSCLECAHTARRSQPAADGLRSRRTRLVSGRDRAGGCRHVCLHVCPAHPGCMSDRSRPGVRERVQRLAHQIPRKHPSEPLALEAYRSDQPSRVAHEGSTTSRCRGVVLRWRDRLPDRQACPCAQRSRRLWKPECRPSSGAFALPAP